MNLADVVEAHPADAPALIWSGDTTTYGALRDRVARLRGGLAGLGVTVGDRVALALDNSPSFVTSYLAALGLGAVVVPLNPHSPARELQRELASARPRVLVTGSSAESAIAAVERTAVPHLDHVVAVGTPGIAETVAWTELEQAGPTPLVEREADNLAVLVFTSGTAGAPRAAMLTHGNLLANIAQLRDSDPALNADDVSLGALPMFHIYGLNVVLGVTLATGGCVLLQERFDPHSTAEAVRRHGVTVVVGVPTMWSAWTGLPDDDAVDPDAFAGVRLATSGAAPLDPEVRTKVCERFGVRLTEGYGLTEASPAVTTGLGVEAPHGSVGVPLPGVAVRVVDSDSRDDVLVGDPGEVWVRGPNVFVGYWDDPEATGTALTPDGWLRTGDLAVVDDEGFLYLVDRAKDIVIVSGFNVYPAEVEGVLASHPAIAEAGVVGKPDPRTGEAVVAYVVPKQGQNLDVDELTTHCNEHLARYKCPTELHVVDALPHNITGKVVRRAIGSRDSL